MRRETNQSSMKARIVPEVARTCEECVKSGDRFMDETEKNQTEVRQDEMRRLMRCDAMRCDAQRDRMKQYEDENSINGSSVVRGAQRPVMEAERVQSERERRRKDSEM